MTTNPEWSGAARRRLERLVAAVIDGRITASEQEELARLLAHESARELFLEHMEIEALLRSREYRVGAGAPVVAAPTRPMARVPGSWLRPLLMSSLAASLFLALGIGLGVWLRTETETASEPLATVVEARQAIWGGGRREVTPASGFGLGRLELQLGMVRIRTRSSVELTLMGPCVFEFLDFKTIRLHRGELKVKVETPAIGFRVLTPTTDIVDLGTEFGVLVEANGSSEVHVFQGVVVARPLGADQVVPIYCNEAGRVDAPEANARDSDQMPIDRPPVLLAIAARPELFRQGAAGATRAVSNPRLQRPTPLTEPARVLFCGDPYLDSDTPLLLLEQAWSNAGLSPGCRFFNGFYPDSIQQYTERIEHHVFRYHPTHVVLSFGPQIARLVRKNVSVEQFGADLETLVARIRREGIEVILTTAYRFPSSQSAWQSLLDQYNGQVRTLARREGLRLADIDERFRRAGDVESLVNPKGFVIGFAAYQLMAAALLESFGHPEIPVPNELDLHLLPGVITDWAVKAVPPNQPPLTSESIAQLAPDESWTRLRLPQHDSFSSRLADPSHSRLYQDRSRGLASHLTTPELPFARAVASVHSDEAKEAFLQVGGNMHEVWLNGSKVFDLSHYPGIIGAHPGSETIPVTLRAGDNRLVIECRRAFFVSITETFDPPSMTRPSNPLRTK